MQSPRSGGPVSVIVTCVWRARAGSWISFHLPIWRRAGKRFQGREVPLLVVCLLVGESRAGSGLKRAESRRVSGSEIWRRMHSNLIRSLSSKLNPGPAISAIRAGGTLSRLRPRCARQTEWRGEETGVACERTERAVENGVRDTSLDCIPSVLSMLT